MYCQIIAHIDHKLEPNTWVYSYQFILCMGGIVMLVYNASLLTNEVNICHVFDRIDDYLYSIEILDICHIFENHYEL